MPCTPMPFGFVLANACETNLAYSRMLPALAAAGAWLWSRRAANRRQHDVRRERAACRAVSRERQRHAWQRDCAPRCVAASEWLGKWPIGAPSGKAPEISYSLLHCITESALHSLCCLPTPPGPGAWALARYGSCVRSPAPIRETSQLRRLQLMRITSG